MFSDWYKWFHDVLEEYGEKASCLSCIGSLIVSILCLIWFFITSEKGLIVGAGLFFVGGLWFYYVNKKLTKHDKSKNDGQGV